jgi:capsular polysaccharide biosynthesis protein
MEIINLYQAPSYIDIGERIDNDPPVYENINLYHVKNATITSFGYTISKFKVLKETISFRHRNVFTTKNIFSALYLKHKISINSPAISISNGWYDSYYHFTLECLPKLYLLREYINQSKIIFPSKNSSFHNQWFKILGLQNIMYIDQNQVIKTPLAIVCNFSARDLNHHNIILPEFRQWILSHVENKTSLNYKKIFVGRKNPSHRILLNLEAVKEFLVENNFVYLELENFTVEEQIKIFYNAQQIVCVHGAALSNLCFSNPKTKVLDLIHQEFKQWCFLKMSVILDIDYQLFNCIGSGENNLPGYQNITVDLLKLKKYIEKWSL